MPVQLQRRYRFSASHRYYRPEWSDAENRSRFGKCANDPGHGHNYVLRIRVEGEPDPATGFLVDLPELDELVRREILEPLDHHHVNQAIPSFAAGERIPSSENLVLWIRDRLLPHFGGATRLAAIELMEDEDLGAIWTPG